MLWVEGWIMELKERIEQAKEKSGKDGMFTSESEFTDDMMAIRRDFVTIHGEMVLLKNYNSLSFAAQAQDDHVLVSAKITRLQKKWQGGGVVENNDNIPKRYQEYDPMIF
ncbi:SPX domain-containing protein 4-like protein [Tanacetum coccineum]